MKKNNKMNVDEINITEDHVRLLGALLILGLLFVFCVIIASTVLYQLIEINKTCEYDQRYIFTTGRCE
jgi:hypothetical protein